MVAPVIVGAGIAGISILFKGCTSQNEIKDKQKESQTVVITNDDLQAAWENSGLALCPTDNIDESMPVTQITKELAQIILEKNSKAQNLNPYEKEVAITALKSMLDKALEGKNYNDIESTHWAYCKTYGIYGRPFIASLETGINSQSIANLIDSTKNNVTKAVSDSVKIETASIGVNAADTPVPYTITITPASTTGANNQLTAVPLPAPEKGTYLISLEAGASIKVANLKAETVGGNLQITSDITVTKNYQSCMLTPPKMVIAYKEADGSVYELARIDIKFSKSGNNLILRADAEEATVAITTQATPAAAPVNFEKNCKDSGGAWKDNKCECTPPKILAPKLGKCYEPKAEKPKQSPCDTAAAEGTIKPKKLDKCKTECEKPEKGATKEKIINNTAFAKCLGDI